MVATRCKYYHQVSVGHKKARRQLLYNKVSDKFLEEKFCQYNVVIRRKLAQRRISYSVDSGKYEAF